MKKISQNIKNFLSKLNFLKKKELTTKEELDKYIQENITLLEKRAVQLNNNVGRGSWFTIKDVVARTKHKDINSLMKLLSLLSSAKLIVSTISVDRNGLHVEKYKVLLDNVTRSLVIKGEIERLRKEIERLEKLV